MKKITSKNAQPPGSELLESDNLPDFDLSLLMCNKWLSDEKRYCCKPCVYLFFDGQLCEEHAP